ncbi:hypothetical protein AAFC00_000996 [Neodothiora populina]|uniref:Haloacid dehalogenase n=1 Tax=Neodothiora populina TaxID=2781224 RepID=A0ABR3PMF6_9PEZI
MVFPTSTHALLFDVFGTCVDWRKTVTFALANASLASLKDDSAAMDKSCYTKARHMSLDDWGQFAQEWRNTYYSFTRSVASNSSLRWKTVDDHHLESLQEVLLSHGLQVDGNGRGLWTDEQIKDMSYVWHRLDPWSDTVSGLAALNTKFQTCTLSNGNMSLLKDMQEHGHMPFTHTFSSELFNSYKPNPAIYLGAAKRLGIDPGECAMVAAHLGDLQAAKNCGYHTIYVERDQEEEPGMVQVAREQGFVDLWIGIEADGFRAVARELGCVLDD